MVYTLLLSLQALWSPSWQNEGSGGHPATSAPREAIVRCAFRDLEVSALAAGLRGPRGRALPHNLPCPPTPSPGPDVQGPAVTEAVSWSLALPLRSPPGQLAGYW